MYHLSKMTMIGSAANIFRKFTKMLKINSEQLENIAGKTLVGLIFLLLSIFIGSNNFSFVSPKSFPNQNLVLGESMNSASNSSLQPVVTESRFDFEIITQEEKIPKKTSYEDNPEIEAGIDTVLEEGTDGKRIKTIKVTLYLNKELSRNIIETKVVPAKDKVISRGTKIIWRTIQTPDGEIRYWKKMMVFATHYDSRCLGCNEWTAIGMRAGKGVIAVDPKVIKLRSKVYISGYGFAVAGDTGGAIKGNIIDLGFEDAKTAGWGARYTDIYLLD